MPPRKKKPLVDVPQDTDSELDAQLAEHAPDVIDPGYDGHRMRVAGVPWSEIATKIGSSSASGAMQVVSRYLTAAAKAQSASQMQEALMTQVDRYETILHSWWELATTGKDEKAATVVLRAMERLDRILRLADGEVSISRETIVVSANPEEYVKQLQGVVSERSNRSAASSN
jgi:hypothetical protein